MYPYYPANFPLNTPPASLTVLQKAQPHPTSIFWYISSRPAHFRPTRRPAILKHVNWQTFQPYNKKFDTSIATFGHISTTMWCI